MASHLEPEQHSADLSLFVLDAGVRLLEAGRARLLYLSLSDYVQHRYAPQEPDARLGRLMDLGPVVAATADHGMHDMAKPDGTPNVIFVGDVLDAAFGAGSCRVICPITDPFVRHHGALGGFARPYRSGWPQCPRGLGYLAGLPGVEQALEGAEACRRYDLAAEQRVPFLLSTPLASAWRAAHPQLRNYDIFDAALNGAAA